jgi:uncharacterized protein (TIGR03067 family)
LSNDVQRLQGTWLADVEPGLQARLVFDGSRLRLVHIHKQGETLLWDGHFAVNEQADPKQMDWTPLRQGGNNPSANLAIYRLEGDLLLVIGSTKAPRPNAFYSGGAYPSKTMIYRRLKRGGERNMKRRLPVEDASSEGAL